MIALVLFLGGLCWVFSLWFPAFYTDTEMVMGYWTFLTGWLGIVIFQFAWLANLLIFLAVLWMYRYPIRATLLAVCAVLLASHSFWFVVMPGAHENVNVIGFGIGFWLWYASMGLLCIGVIFGSDEELLQSDNKLTEKKPHRLRPVSWWEGFKRSAAPLTTPHSALLGQTEPRLSDELDLPPPIIAPDHVSANRYDEHEHEPTLLDLLEDKPIVLEDKPALFKRERD